MAWVVPCARESSRSLSLSPALSPVTGKEEEDDEAEPEAEGWENCDDDLCPDGTRGEGECGGIGVKSVVMMCVRRAHWPPQI